MESCQFPQWGAESHGDEPSEVSVAGEQRPKQGRAA